MAKYLQSFEFKFQKGRILDKILHIFADVSRKNNLIFFLCGVIDQLCRSNPAKIQVI